MGSPFPTSEKTAFVKFDTGKLRYDLITPEFLRGLAHNLTVGAAKYGDRNWEIGTDWSRYIASTMRHWEAWRDGEEFDDDGFHHLDAVAFGVMVLTTFGVRCIGNDDRRAARVAEKRGAAREYVDNACDECTCQLCRERGV